MTQTENLGGTCPPPPPPPPPPGSYAYRGACTLVLPLFLRLYSVYNKKCGLLSIYSMVYTMNPLLTGSPTVMTPRSFTTLGCLNCPLMAASRRNLTLSFSSDPSFSVFTATSTAPVGDCHIPLFTVPNWPEPRCSVILKKHTKRSPKL